MMKPQFISFSGEGGLSERVTQEEKRVSQTAEKNARRAALHSGSGRTGKQCKPLAHRLELSPDGQSLLTSGEKAAP